ncbi:MAG: hypothetical protein N2D54_00685, partial [Chloroflexota bacterium]
MEKQKASILEDFNELMLPLIEEEMRQCVGISHTIGLEELHHMMAYHLGWEGEDSGALAQGKRVRPMMVLLSNAAAGGDWRIA